MHGVCRHTCPYHASRDVLTEGAALIFVTYSQLLDPPVRSANGLDDLLPGAAVIFDEVSAFLTTSVNGRCPTLSVPCLQAGVRLCPQVLKLQTLPEARPSLSCKTALLRHASTQESETLLHRMPARLSLMCMSVQRMCVCLNIVVV